MFGTCHPPHFLLTAFAEHPPLSHTSPLEKKRGEAPLQWSRCLLLSGYLVLPGGAESTAQGHFPWAESRDSPKGTRAMAPLSHCSSPPGIFSRDLELTLEPPQPPCHGHLIQTSCFLTLSQGRAPRLAHINRSINIFAITGGSQLSLPIYHLCFMLLSNLCVFDPGY